MKTFPIIIHEAEREDYMLLNHICKVVSQRSIENVTQEIESALTKYFVSLILCGRYLTWELIFLGMNCRTGCEGSLRLELVYNKSV